MSKQSAGLLVYREKDGVVEVLLGHPGGPFFARKDNGAWSIIKGEFDGEDPLTAAKREFNEETGAQVPLGEYIELGTVKTKGGKTIYGWAVQADFDTTNLKSNTFELEWPPKSGQIQKFPEIDKFVWFSLSEATEKLNPAQVEFIKRLADKLQIEITKKPEQSSLF